MNQNSTFSLFSTILLSVLTVNSTSQSFIPHWQGADSEHLVHWLEGESSGYAAHGYFFYQVNDFGLSYQMISYDALLQFLAMDFISDANGWAIKKNDSFEMFATHTTDSGANWTTEGMIPEFESNPVLAAWSDNLLLCGANTHMYRSIDGGDVWTQVATMPQGINGIFFRDANEVWAASTMGLVYRSDDGGANWTSVAAGISTTYFADEVQFTSANTIYISVGGGGGIIRKSVDDGQNWTTINTTVAPITATKVLSDTHIFVASQLEILETTNGGTNWSVLHNWGSSRIQNHFWNAEDDLLVLNGWGGQIFKQNADMTWTEMNAGFQVTTQIDFINDIEGWALGQGQFSNKLYRTINGGVTWHESNAPSGITFVDFVDSEIGFATTSTNFYRTDDGGETWVLKSDDFFDFTKVEIVDEQNIHLLLSNDILWNSFDGGDTWQSGFYNDPIPVAVFPFYDMEFVNENDGFLSGDSGGNPTGTVFYTEDGGLNWYKNDNFPASNDLPECVYINANIGIHSTVNTLYKTTNGGSSWSTINVPNLSGNYLGNMYFRTSLLGWASAGYTLRKTVNGGSTWSDISEFWMGDGFIGSFNIPSDDVGYMASSFGFVRWGDAPCALPFFTASFEYDEVQVCAGNNAFISFDSSDPVETVEWYFNDVLISTNTTLIILNTDVSDSGVYECHLTKTNACGEFNLVLEASLEVVTEVVPIVSIEATDAMLCEGETLELSATVSEGFSPTFFWYQDGNSIAIGETLVLEDAEEFMAGEYHCEAMVNTVCGSVTVSSESLPVSVFESFTIQLPYIETVQMVCEGEAFTLQNTAFGNPPVSYQWLFDGEVVSNSNVLQFPSVQLNQQGIYTLNAFDESGCGSEMQTQEVELYVGPIPQITEPTTNQMLYTCVGAYVVLQFDGYATSEGIDVFVNWFRDGNYIGFGQEIILPSVSANDFGIYTCDVNYNSGCGDVWETFTMYTLVESNEGPNTTPDVSNMQMELCAGMDVELSFNTTTVINTYAWSFLGNIIGTDASITIENFDASQAGDYYCHVSASSECGDAEGEYLMYTLVLGDGLPEIEVSNANTVLQLCEGESLEFLLESDSEMNAYNWTLDGNVVGNNAQLSLGNVDIDDAGEYFCHVTLANQCGVAEETFLMLTLEVNALPEIFEPEFIGDIVYCAGENMSLGIFPETENTTYEWFLNGVFIADGNPLLVEDVSADNNGLYSVLITTTNDCGSIANDFDIANVLISQVLPPIITNNNGVLELQQAYFSYQWFFNGELIGEEATVVVDGEGLYTVVVTNQNGCVAETTADIVDAVDEQELIIISAYPNPFSHFVRLHGNSIIDRVEVHDIAGASVAVLRPLVCMAEFDLQWLASGVYTLQIEFANRSCTTLQLVKE